MVDDLISRVKDREPVDWKYHFGENVYVIIKARHLTIHVRKYFVPNGEWTLHDMTDVTRILEDPGEATTIVHKFVLLLIENVV